MRECRWRNGLNWSLTVSADSPCAGSVSGAGTMSYGRTVSDWDIANNAASKESWRVTGTVSTERSVPSDNDPRFHGEPKLMT